MKTHISDTLGIAATSVVIYYQMIADTQPSSQFWNYVKSSNGLEIMTVESLFKKK